MTDYRLPSLVAPMVHQPDNSDSGKVNDYALCQKYAAYTAQLRGLLQDTTGELPFGVQTAEVEHRILLIQSALDEVERLHAEARWRIEYRNNQRLLENYERQMEAEEAAEKKRQEAEKERVAQVEEMRSMQVAYYRDRNDRTDMKAKQCRAYNSELQVHTVMKAGSSEARRKRNLANLEVERQRKLKELHDRMEAKQEYTRRVRERQAALIAEKHARNAQIAEIRSHEIEAKLRALREAKRCKWTEKKEASRFKSVIVWKRGEAILETQLKDHNCLLEELERREREQEMRYAEEKAEQQAYFEQRKMLRNVRQERNDENIRKLIDKRLTRGMEIVKAVEEKRERAVLAKEQQAARYIEAGKMLDEDLVQHRLRAQKMQEYRTNASLAQNFRRWNHRAARIMEELQREREAQVSEADSPSSSNRKKNEQTMSVDGQSRTLEQYRIASSRAIISDALPSPSDFAV